MRATRFLVTIAVVVALVAFARFGSAVSAQTPTPAPGPTAYPGLPEIPVAPACPPGFAPIAGTPDTPGRCLPQTPTPARTTTSPPDSQTGATCLPFPTSATPMGEGLVATVTSDAVVYSLGAAVRLTVTLTNPTTTTVVTVGAGLLLPQFSIRTAAGERVWLYPTIPYPLPPGRCTFEPGAVVTRSIVWNQRRAELNQRSEGDQVAPGVYVVSGGLTNVIFSTDAVTITIQGTASTSMSVPTPRPIATPGPPVPTPIPAPTFTPPSPAPARGPSFSVAFGDGVTLPPYGAATFFYPIASPLPQGPGQTPAPLPRGIPPPVQVQSYSDQPAELTSGDAVTIAVAEGLAIQVGALGGSGGCLLVDGQPNVVRCSFNRFFGSAIQFTTVSLNLQSPLPLSPCPPSGEAPGVLWVVFRPGTPAGEQAAAHAAAGATPGEGQESVFADGSVGVTVTVAPGTEQAALQVYRAWPSVQSTMRVALSPPRCPVSTPAIVGRFPVYPATIPSTLILAARTAVAFSNSMGAVQVANASAFPARVSYDGVTLVIVAHLGLTLQVSPVQPPCSSPTTQPNVVTCPLALGSQVRFDASGDPTVFRAAFLDLNDPRPCIPETGQRACGAERESLWNGDAAAWARTGVSDPDARFNQTVVLRVRAGDPAAISAIARILGTPYLKVTQLQFAGDTEFAEITNLGGGRQELTGWTLRSPVRGAVYRLPVGVTLNPGQRCRLYTGPPLTNPGGECRAFTRTDGIDALSRNAADVWPDEGGEVVLFYDALALPGDATRYSADSLTQPPPPNLQVAPRQLLRP